MEKALKALGKSGEPIASSPQLCSSMRSFLALFLGDFMSIGHSKVGTIFEERTARNPTSLVRLSRQPAPRLWKTVFTEPSILRHGGCSGSVLSLVLFIAHILWLLNELWPLICAKLQDEFLEGIRGSLSHPKGPSLPRRGHMVSLLFFFSLIPGKNFKLRDSFDINHTIACYSWETIVLHCSLLEAS